MNTWQEARLECMLSKKRGDPLATVRTPGTDIKRSVVFWFFPLQSITSGTESAAAQKNGVQ